MRLTIAAIVTSLLVSPAGAQAQAQAVASPMPTLTLAIGQAPATPIRDAMIKEAARAAMATWPAPATQVPPPQRNWAARHPVLLGTLIGTGVGLTWVAVEGCSSSDYTCSAIAAFAAGTGALLGAVGGLVVALALP